MPRKKKMLLAWLPNSWQSNKDYKIKLGEEGVELYLNDECLKTFPLVEQAKDYAEMMEGFNQKWNIK